MAPVPLREGLARHLQLNEEEFALISEAMLPRTHKRKAIIQQAGESAQYIIYIREGLLRYYYLVNGEERTGQFFFEGGWLTDMDSILSGTPSQFYIDALEPCQLRMLHKDRLPALYAASPKLVELGQIMMQNAFRGSRYRTNTVLSMTPEEHYRYLLDNRPKVISRVPLFHIASYLGIKPESLSRIRKRILEEERGS
ncbi:MAG: Crp/Fnr family transcriptional regulator [Bacteroidota bacterium]